MRGLPLVLLLVVAAACATPPRIDDRSTPRLAYETFRGALARGEIEREYACFSLEMRERRLAMSLAEYRDARTVAITETHLFVRGVKRSEVSGDPRPEGDRADLEIRFPFGYRARVTMRRMAVLRAYREGEERPQVERWLPEFVLRPGGGGVEIPVPPEILETVELALRKSKTPIRRVEAALEWFLEDFDAGGQTPETVRKDAESAKKPALKRAESGSGP